MSNTREKGHGLTPYLIVAVVFLFIAFVGGAWVASARTFTNFPQHFFIAGIDVGGLNAADARTLVHARMLERVRDGVPVYIEGIGTRTLPLALKGEPIFTIDLSATMHEALTSAQRWRWSRTVAHAVGIDYPTRIDAHVQPTDRTTLLLASMIDAWHVPLTAPRDARFDRVAVNGALQVSVVSSTDGQKLDTARLAADVQEAIASTQTPALTAHVIHTTAEVTTDQAHEVLAQAQVLVDDMARTRELMIQGKRFPISDAQLVRLVQPRVQDGTPTVSIAADGLRELFGGVLGVFEQPGQNAVFIQQGNRIVTFVPHQMGIAIDWDGTARALFNSLSSSATSTIVAVQTKETPPQVTLDQLNDLGIKEIIGIGTSDFSGSTKNRIHNITTGMHALNGVLISPGETFSLVKTLGNIDASTGYTQELVIKDNKTQPDFGGGLCQIGTTTFRAALDSGLPIVERQNHSYQVHYYFENGVSGTDATIYDPKPDLRFTNDTGNWIMVETRMSGHILTFVFWGTKDGRVAERTIPKVLSTTPAPPKKTIESTDIPVGTTKCTELAHVGAHLVFTYTVRYPDGTTKKVDFNSLYKPWGEVCLVGVMATSTPSGVSSGSGSTALPINLSPDAAGVTGN